MPSQVVLGVPLTCTITPMFLFELMLLCSSVCQEWAWEAPPQYLVLSKAILSEKKYMQ